MNRREFLGGLLGASFALTLDPRPLFGQERRFLLPRPETLSGDRITLIARTAQVNLGAARSEAWTLNGALPSPTLRLRRGDVARIRLENRLQEPTILHWHGLDVPEPADGHPRLAIAPGASYDYEFRVTQRAGTYWYHPHTHMRTAPQTYLGMAGFLIIEDDEEEALELPTGEYEIPILIQDKRFGGTQTLAYTPSMHDQMEGYLGNAILGNGALDPTVNVRRARYRLRLLNGCNARILELSFGEGNLFTLIGTDGGLLETPVDLDSITLATGERADVLVDFSRFRPGSRIMLRSLPFEIPGAMAMGMGMGMGPRGGPGQGGMGPGRGMGPGMGMGPGGMMGGGVPQGSALDLVEFVVQDTPPETSRPLPARLSEVPRVRVTSDTPVRSFRLRTEMMRHTINGASFDLTRIDERIPIGRTEIWEFVNESPLPHPIHIHHGQFNLLSRMEGREQLMPWEAGLKDTVLILPQERVAFAVRFDSNPGLFLLHCHNLEHEDMGMMLNFRVDE